MIRVFGRIGVLSFGGPAAQIGLMHRALVEDAEHLTDRQFMGALSFCMLLPGPEAMQLATYAGWRMRGALGGVLAGLLFVLPGALVVAALALAYIHHGQLPLVQAAFTGIKAAVIAILAGALWRIGRKALTGPAPILIACAGFAALYALNLPFALIIAAAGAYGYLSAPRQGDAPTPRQGDAPAPCQGRAPAPPRHQGSLVQLLFWGGLWLALPLALWLAGAVFLTDLALFFGKLALVSFGGAYAVLGLMAQTVVDARGWLTPEQMIDALGLAETTPGPLILVTEFTALLAGHQMGGTGLGLAAAGTALWMTFIPCFAFIFAGAPYLEWIMSRPRLSGALGAITAAVVGVIANLALWFALHVLFARVQPGAFGPLPDFSSFQPVAAGLTLLAALLLARLPMLAGLGLMALAGLLAAGVT